jgi:hypothetical protein
VKVVQNERKQIMFTKISKISLALLIVAFFITNISVAQTKKVEYPIFSISPIGGVQFPVGGLNDSYGVSWNAGLDLSLKVNKETAFYLNAAYFDMPLKAGMIGANASYIAISAGPRYYFASPKLKAQFFLEAGIGAYIFTQKEYTVTSPSLADPTVIVPSVTKTNFGVNVGPGVTIPLGGTVDLIMKSKLHYTFQSGGSHTFISAVTGVEFRL